MYRNDAKHLISQFTKIGIIIIRAGHAPQSQIDLNEVSHYWSCTNNWKHWRTDGKRIYPVYIGFDPLYLRRIEKLKYSEYKNDTDVKWDVPANKFVSIAKVTVQHI